MFNVATEGATGAAQSPINPSPTFNPADRQAQLEALFTRNYPAVVDAASAPDLFVEDIDRLVNAASRQLNNYDGPLEDQPFVAWINSSVRPGAERLSAFYRLRRENSKVVKKAIWSIIKTSGDLGAYFGEDGPDSPISTVKELEEQTWLKVFQRLDYWLAPGVPTKPGGKLPKFSTRIYPYARAQAQGWRTDRLRIRKKYIELDVHLDDIARMERRIEAGLPLVPRAPRRADEAEAEEALREPEPIDDEIEIDQDEPSEVEPVMAA